MIVRYVFRHLRRSPLKSLLCLLLAGALIAALGQFIVVVQQAHETVDEMYADLEVDALLAGVNGTMGEGMPLSVLQQLLDTDFSESFYATASCPFYWVNESGIVDPSDTFYMVEHRLIGTNEPKRYTETDITFLDGYDEYVFAESREYICVLNRSTLNKLMLEIGDEVQFSGRPAGTMPGQIQEGIPFKVVGVYDSTSYNSNAILPLWTLEDVQGVMAYGARLTYAEFRVRNDLLRDDDAYRSRPTSVLENSSDSEISHYTLRYLDDELRNVVRPLESNANTLRLLLPIITAVVLIIGAAIPALVVVQTSKDAAMMRVLGMTKTKVRAILTLEQALLCLAGLAIGITALTLVHGETLAGDKLGASVHVILLGLAAGHLALAVAASLVSSVVVSARKPLELLQAKE